MQNDDIHIPRKKMTIQVAIKKCKIKSEKSAIAEKGHTNGIDSFNLADTVYTEYDSVHREENSNGHDSE